MTYGVQALYTSYLMARRTEEQRLIRIENLLKAQQLSLQNTESNKSKVGELKAVIQRLEAENAHLQQENRLLQTSKTLILSQSTKRKSTDLGTEPDQSNDSLVEEHAYFTLPSSPS